MGHCIILVTCPTESDAVKLASDLVTNKLAACAQIHPVKSIYTWKGKVHHDPEFRLIIKTKGTLYKEAETFICNQHGYEVPQIVRVPIEDGLTSYLDWIDESTT